jgi:hypothetical protein
MCVVAAQARRRLAASCTASTSRPLPLRWGRELGDVRGQVAEGRDNRVYRSIENLLYMEGAWPGLVRELYFRPEARRAVGRTIVCFLPGAFGPVTMYL